MDKEKIGAIFLKNKNMRALYIILITGVVILILSNVFSPEKKPDTTDVKSIAIPTKQLAAEMEEILSEIKGAGNVKVMITYESTGEKHLAADVTSEQRRSGSGEIQNSEVQTKQSKKLFAPDDTAVVTKESFPKVMGVIVVCDGGADVKVKEDMTSAVSAALDVAKHKISIFERK